MGLRVEKGDDNVPFVQLGECQLRLDLEDLDETYKERAKNELRETPEVVENALREFREFIQKEPGLHLPLDDVNFLLKFLRPFKFYPDSAFRVLKKFYKFKLKHPKYGVDVTPNSVRHVFDNEVFVFLPTRTPTGSRIMIINAGTKWNPKDVAVADMFRAIMVAIEIAMLEPKTQVAGVHVILNMEGFSLNHVYQFSPTVAKLMVDWVQDCAPVRLKGIHIINQSIFFNMVYAIFKPFIGEKLKKRLFFHGSNKEILCKHMSADALPTHFGGSGKVPEYPGRLLSEMLFFYEELFEKFNSYRYIKET
ncbi:alpha-tocopherol transfer protein [Tribolium castaneum]|uniref:Alpha-tocopherol transfer protein-like Protein n=1 Tax=Tribolium castaneum TaxID=7070 RepID=D6WLC7_TRICA|nr:PREDICTED: alpha-tocopherol transfer protein [Tribolium castaneum]EFA03469.2 Alpha-tocopherol transfer protein-like Protein [Tribolium castaneum]|eukprot:XP_001815618.1 PREDICTED: alpha-tocopherol transfer protein [Tribolium castaneum]